jgi:uncharacterized membrane protein YdfJ with MMPL/SSD domain
MKEKIFKKIEDAMHSIDDIKKASPNPFFFTRLEARMQNEKNIWEKITVFLTRPSIAFATISFIVMLNAIVIFSSSKTKNTASTQNNELAAIDEYTQVTATLFEYENVKP